MLRPKNLTDLYFWTLHFDGGTVIDQRETNKADKCSRVDPNNPCQGFGRAFCICLLPRKAHLRPLSMLIPEGARPVYFGRTMGQGDIPIHFEYAIGYAIDGHRWLKVVDPETGISRDEEDEDG